MMECNNLLMLMNLCFYLFCLDGGLGEENKLLIKIIIDEIIIVFTIIRMVTFFLFIFRFRFNFITSTLISYINNIT